MFVVSKRSSFALSLGVLLVLVAASLASAASGVTVGAILPFSGAEADIGQEYERVIERAVVELGVDIEVLYADSAGDLAKATAAFSLLVDKGIDVVFTVQSWVSNEIYPLAQEEGILHIALGSAVFNRDSADDLSVRLTQDYKDEAAVLAAYVADRFDRVAIVHMNNDYGRGWATELAALIAGELGQTTGTKVVASAEYNLEESNFAPLVASIAEHEPDVLVLLSTAEAAQIIRAIEAKGLGLALVGTRPIERPEVAAEPNADGLVFTVPAWDSDGALSEWYSFKYNDDMTVFGAEAYDAVATLALASETCGTDAACLKAWYVDRQYDGVLGTIQFDSVGDAHYEVTFRELRDGKFVNF